MNPVNMKSVLREATVTLEQSGLEESRLESEVLLCYVLGIDRTQLHIGLKKNITHQQKRQFLELINRRLYHEPIAYLTGHREFFGLDFMVTYETLIPRPETELIVETALSLNERRSPEIKTIVDVGTGCGAIAVALAVNMPNIELTAIDISPSALEVAVLNASRHDVSRKILFLEGNLLEPLAGSVDIIIANLPYVRVTDMCALDDDVRLFEPELALSGGVDGLDYIKQLLEQAGSHLNSRGAIILEISPDQRMIVVGIAEQLFPKATINVIPDLSGNDRVMCIETADLNSGNLL